MYIAGSVFMFVVVVVVAVTRMLFPSLSWHEDF